jgi:hypothetical protein
MTRFATLRGALRRGRTEGCFFEKISMLISAEGFTVERGLSSPGCVFEPAPHVPPGKLVPRPARLHDDAWSGAAVD